MISLVFLGTFPVYAQPAASAPAPEDKSAQGVTVAPSISIYPAGYDSINITGAEGGRYFFSLKPAVALDTVFKTAAGRPISFSVAYEMGWREYFNKEATSRDFDHALSGSIEIPWSERLSAKIDTAFDYFYKAGADTAFDNGLMVETEPALHLRIDDRWNVKAGYWMRFLDIFDWKLPVDSADIEDIQAEFEGAAAAAPGAPQSVYTSHHAIAAGAQYEPAKGTKLNLNYRWVLGGFSNFASQRWKGHFFLPSVTQEIPWTGGEFTFADEFRLRKFTDDPLEDGALRQDYRNWMTFSYAQPLGERVSTEVLYRLELSGINEDDYDAIDSHHWFYLGTTVTF